MRIYLKNIRAKFHSDGSLGFSKSSSQQEEHDQNKKSKKNNIKMSSLSIWDRFLIQKWLSMFCSIQTSFHKTSDNCA